MKFRTNADLLADEMSNPLKENVPFSAEAMKLLINAEKRRRHLNGEEEFNCELIDESKGELESFIKELQNTVPTASEPLRLQRIIKSDAHYTTVDIFINKNEAYLLMLDSAGDPRCFSHYLKFKKARQANNDKSLFTSCTMAAPESINREISGTQQDDTFSCSAFAIDYACQASRLQNLHTHVAQHSNREMISWHNLPPTLVWNAHSMTWIKHYIKTHPEEVSIEVPGINQSFLEYINHANAGSTANTNQAIQSSFKHYQSQVSKEDILSSNSKSQMAPPNEIHGSMSILSKSQISTNTKNK